MLSFCFYEEFLSETRRPFPFNLCLSCSSKLDHWAADTPILLLIPSTSAAKCQEDVLLCGEDSSMGGQVAGMLVPAPPLVYSCISGT